MIDKQNKIFSKDVLARMAADKPKRSREDSLSGEEGQPGWDPEDGDNFEYSLWEEQNSNRWNLRVVRGRFNAKIRKVEETKRDEEVTRLVREVRKMVTQHRRQMEEDEERGFAMEEAVKRLIEKARGGRKNSKEMMVIVPLTLYYEALRWVSLNAGSVSEEGDDIVVLERADKKGFVLEEPKLEDVRVKTFSKDMDRKSVEPLEVIEEESSSDEEIVSDNEQEEPTSEDERRVKKIYDDCEKECDEGGSTEEEGEVVSSKAEDGDEDWVGERGEAMKDIGPLKDWEETPQMTEVWYTWWTHVYDRPTEEEVKKYGFEVDDLGDWTLRWKDAKKSKCPAVKKRVRNFHQWRKENDIKAIDEVLAS